VSRRQTGRPGEISIQPGSGFDKGCNCSCWPRPDDARPCTPQTCDWRCRACRIHGRPFYSHSDLQYLEHGTGPLAAELDRLWRVRGAGKRRTVREASCHDVDGCLVLPRGAAGLAPRRPHSRTVTDLYYPGLQDSPPGQDGATPAADSSWK
jgi:hypothetical protein